MPDILLGRINDASDVDVARVLVDRLWPRGVAKERASWQRWCPEVAPSSELRRWLHAHREDYETFCRRYALELTGARQRELLGDLVEIAASQPLMLLTAARQWQESHLPVLRQALLALLASDLGPAALPPSLPPTSPSPSRQGGGKRGGRA